jgi:Secretion system C-terminal sorting domain
MVLKKLIIAILLIAFGTSFSQETVRATVGVSGNSFAITASGKQYVVQQSIGQASVIGANSTQDFTVLQGFIQPPIEIEAVIDEDNSLGAAVFPNPFTSNVQVRFSEEITAPLSIRLYDIAGRIVFSREVAPAREIQLDFDFLASASYMLSISHASKQFTATLIKN